MRRRERNFVGRRNDTARVDPLLRLSLCEVVSRENFFFAATRSRKNIFQSLQLRNSKLASHA
jgi:hypothetical protein